MTNRKEQILEAAIRTISRYGVRRTSVADIAQEAGVARQTVYNAFDDKDAILKAVVTYIDENTRKAITGALQDAPGLEQKLDIFIEHLAVQKYEMTYSSPEAEDIVSGFHEIARDEIENGFEASRVIIEKTLRPHAKAIRESGLSVKDLSDFIQRSLVQAKKNAKDKKHLMKLLTSLKVLVLNLAAPK